MGVFLGVIKRFFTVQNAGLSPFSKRWILLGINSPIRNRPNQRQTASIARALDLGSRSLIVSLGGGRNPLLIPIFWGFASPHPHALSPTPPFHIWRTHPEPMKSFQKKYQLGVSSGGLCGIFLTRCRILHVQSALPPGVFSTGAEVFCAPDCASCTLGVQ